MNHPLVFNLRTASFPEWEYIGRKKEGMHYGNPFSHQESTLAEVIVSTREDAVTCFAEWLDGTAWPTVEPERRQWIINHIHELADKHLGCFCDPLLCHGTPLANRANTPWVPVTQ